MSGGAYIGQLVGRHFGTFLGRQLALGACRDDREDDFERRIFQPRIAPGEIPPAVDLRPWMPPVENQGRLGSCAANALVGAVEYLTRRETGRVVDYSRLFVYFAQRLWDDSVREDMGASLVDGVRVLSRLGVPTEQSWPYHPDLFAVQPPEPVLREATKTRVTDWWSVPVHPDAIRGCLAAGFPIAFGTKVTESFVATGRDGLCGMPQGADDRRHGRHALLLTGYDDGQQLFVVRNSWGDDWGDGGYVYMPYAYVLNRAWTRNCWAIRLTHRESFDPREHARLDFSRLPKAPPSSGGSRGGAASAVGTAGSIGAQIAVGAFTGSGLLAGLAGGLVSGLTPGVATALSGRDRGATAGPDMSDRILATLRGDGAAPPRGAPMPWDDGLDEEAMVARIGRNSARRRVRASGSPARISVPVAAEAASKPPRNPPEAGASASPATSAIGRSTESVGPPAMREDFIRELPEDIASWWRRDGGRKGPLGSPTSAPLSVAEDHFRGVAVRFEDGLVIAWEPPPGQPRAAPIALSATSPLFTRWRELGGGTSPVGWPVRPAEELRDGGAQLACYRGSLIMHPEYGLHAIHGPIFALWLQLGGLDGAIGYPIEGMSSSDDATPTLRQRFERGTLGWSAARGSFREP